MTLPKAGIPPAFALGTCYFGIDASHVPQRCAFSLLQLCRAPCLATTHIVARQGIVTVIERIGERDSQVLTDHNYHLQQFQTPYLPLPLFKVEVVAVSNPSHLAPLDFFKQQISQPGQAGPTPTIVTSQAARIAGRDAVEVVTTMCSDSNPGITYLVPNSDTLFEIGQFNSDG